ncbi:unnamed protein product [Bursaphelenchus okinawaensis]|uniref:Uncharacterized protein n=1 Tax=Bursaphelenchus okinawaensis TaxID=465554 RepID=A0A811LLS5_9BILA|nr:unnamed protein product [Bursaphelenchus okinawaensis]CAG9124778.1 unnamed protein product [Bursaphelenchus okinawaensis]
MWFYSLCLLSTLTLTSAGTLEVKCYSCAGEACVAPISTVCGINNGCIRVSNSTPRPLYLGCMPKANKDHEKYVNLSDFRLPDDWYVTACWTDFCNAEDSSATKVLLSSLIFFAFTFWVVL